MRNSTNARAVSAGQLRYPSATPSPADEQLADDARRHEPPVGADDEHLACLEGATDRHGPGVRHVIVVGENVEASVGPYTFRNAAPGGGRARLADARVIERLAADHDLREPVEDARANSGKPFTKAPGDGGTQTIFGSAARLPSCRTAGYRAENMTLLLGATLVCVDRFDVLDPPELTRLFLATTTASSQ
ncbi:uncharacterized protein PHACADRAFT_200690 [Phanerochaete carnosa HHB-10118-sp]|uniref:Uncharacterized protein n=1 Tax=Phanerochaete carnosa (strain HHB-10118-sp) TaxID=650164 RepID=K5WKG2_PHACS|nr:uncharacterized protein PHACADRAFT_200690 [Phanerochaete carnosa HHB-10118-sp]EKM50752.1 hypothetical protein PHACADRAFT_200690 [Phanerochaete carnosa HHB-10118-sp]